MLLLLSLHPLLFLGWVLLLLGAEDCERGWPGQAVQRVRKIPKPKPHDPGSAVAVSSEQGEQIEWIRHGGVTADLNPPATHHCRQW